MKDFIHIYGYDITELLTNRNLDLRGTDADFQSILKCLDKASYESGLDLTQAELQNLENDKKDNVIESKCGKGEQSRGENEPIGSKSFCEHRGNVKGFVRSDKICAMKKGRYQEVFPEILFKLLDRVDDNGRSHIISWLPHGRAFKIYDEALFEEQVLKQYFNSTFDSFKHQLYSYGFKKIGKRSVDTGAYFHEQFIREQQDLCSKICKWNKKASKFTSCSPNFDKIRTTLKNLYS